MTRTADRSPDIESLIAAAQTRHRLAPEIVGAAYCNWCLKDWPCPDRILIDALAAPVSDPACPDCEVTHPWRDHGPLDEVAPSRQSEGLDAELLARAITLHRVAQRLDGVDAYLGHACMGDCAADILARLHEPVR